MSGKRMMKKMNIKDLRKVTGLTQGQFGVKYHIPVRTLQHWENGDRQPMECIEYLLERIIREDYNMRNIEVTGSIEDSNNSDIMIFIGDHALVYDVSGWRYFSIEENADGIISQVHEDMEITDPEETLLKAKLMEFFKD